MCFDWKEKDWALFGSWHTRDDFTSIEFAYFPCASLITLYDGSTQGGHEGCVWN